MLSPADPQDRPPDSPLRRGLRRGGHTCLVLFRITVPTFVMMDLLKRLGVIAAIGEYCAPVMKLFHLPGEAAVPVLLGFVVNVYAAAAALGSLGLSGGQVTTLGFIIALAHALPVETLVLRAAGARAGSLLVYRLALSALAGYLASRVFIGGVS